jgi:ribonuclease BN (tRNA processing enzyme)
LGFRVRHHDVVVAYLPDVQQPLDGSFAVDDAVFELAENADLLIHDSQYTPKEFEQRSHWGHCTPEFAIATAQKCGVKSLALFHHDPSRTDHDLDHSPYLTHGHDHKQLHTFIAREGMTLCL